MPALHPIFSSFCGKFLFFIVSALFMECKLRYDILPQPQGSKTGIWPSCFYSGAEPKWRLQPGFRTNLETSTEATSKWRPTGTTMADVLLNSPLANSTLANSTLANGGRSFAVYTCKHSSGHVWGYWSKT